MQVKMKSERKAMKSCSIKFRVSEEFRKRILKAVTRTSEFYNVSEYLRQTIAADITKREAKAKKEDAE